MVIAMRADDAVQTFDVDRDQLGPLVAIVAQLYKCPRADLIHVSHLLAGYLDLDRSEQVSVRQMVEDTCDAGARRGVPLEPAAV